VILEELAFLREELARPPTSGASVVIADAHELATAIATLV